MFFPTGFIDVKPFPQIKSVTSGNSTVANTSKSVTFSGVSAGDLIVVLFGGYSDAGPTVNLPSGYTNISSNTTGRTTMRNFYKVAAGGETSVTVTGGVNFFAAWAVFIISGAASAEGTATTGTSGNPNPPSETASWGADSNLFIACMTQFSTPVSQSAPSGYTGFGQVVANTGNDTPRTAWASMESYSATEDPGTFGAAIAGSLIGWVAATISIQPA